MTEGYRRLQALKPSEESTVDVDGLMAKCYAAMDDDLNTPVLLAHLFDACGIINRINDGHDKATAKDLDTLKSIFDTFLIEILGMRLEGAGSETGASDMKPYEEAVDLLLEMRSKAKANKDWTTSDMIRDRLAAIGFDVKDTKNGFEWSLK